MSTSSAPAAHRLPGLLVGGGGALFAAGNLLHPLEHSEAAHSAATWEAAHLIFALGGLLIAAGLPLLLVVGQVVRPSRLVMTGGVLLAVAFAALAPGAWFEAFVAPLPGGVAERLETGPGGAVNGVAGFAWIAGALLFGVGLARRGARRAIRAAGAALTVATVVLAAGPGIPVTEGLWIIPATALIGVALMVPAVAALRRPAVEPGRAARHGMAEGARPANTGSIA
jgi:hypothetical protein